MNKRKLIQVFGVTFLLVLAYWLETGITSPDTASKMRLKMKLLKPTNTEEIEIGINQWLYRMGNDGCYFANNAQTRSGGEYPRGSGQSAIYAGGLYVGTTKPGVGGAEDTIAVSEVEFASEYTPGKLLTLGGLDRLGGYRGSITYNSDSTYTDLFPNLQSDDRGKSEYEVYFIRKDIDPADQPEYQKWKTIPYLPLTSDGEPGLVSDGQTYIIFNDMDLSGQNQPNALHSPNPGMGVEVEMESFAWASGGAQNAYSSIVFLKIMVTNKCARDWPNSYLGIWMDPDISVEAQHDLADIDTNLGMGFVYNDPADGSAATDQISAVGLDFFQGPLVTASDVGADLVARFSGNNTRLRYDPSQNKYVVTTTNPGEFTLGATSFCGFRNGTGEDPGHTLASDDKTRYWYMQGLNHLGAPKPGGPLDRFSGSISGDQRIVFGTGPFIMRSGSTQEVWLGIIGGLGTTQDPVSPNSAVAKVKTYDLVAQKAFNTGFVKPEPPSTPSLSLTGDDGKVILTWDNIAEYSVDTYGEGNGIVSGPDYNKTYRKYDFEGYYLYKSLTGINDDSFERLAVFDLNNGITSYKDTLIEESGELLISYKTIGYDSAFGHDYTDYNVKNGQLYYYSITAFDYQHLYYLNGTPISTDVIPRTQESPLKTTRNFKSVIPQRQIAGYSYDGKVQNKNQISGFNDYYVNYGKTIETRIVDASKIKNRILRVEFFAVDSVDHEPIRGFTTGTLAYRFVDSTTGEILKIDYGTGDNPLTYIDSNRNNKLDLLANGKLNTDSGDAYYDDRYFSTSIAVRNVSGEIISPPMSFPVIDGIEYMPVWLSTNVADVVEITNGSTSIASPRSVLNTPSANGRWQIQVADILKAIPFYITDRMRALRIMDSTFNSAQKDYEIRFSAAGDSGYTRPTSRPLPTASHTFKIPIPFSVINIGKTLNGVNNTSDDTTLYAKISDFNQPINTTGWGYDIGDTNFGYTNMVSAVRNPVYTTPLPATVAASPASTVAFTGLVFKAIIGVNDTASFKANPTSWLPANDSRIRIITAKPLLANDVFRFDVKAHTPYSKPKAKSDLKSIRVVPNPYYGRSDEYQRDAYDKQVKFMRLPPEATIYIFDIAGNMIRKLDHNSTSNNNRINNDPLNPNYNPDPQFTGVEIWDLKNTQGSYVASGMYIALVDVKGVGKTFVKFAIIQEEIRTNVAE